MNSAMSAIRLTEKGDTWSPSEMSEVRSKPESLVVSLVGGWDKVTEKVSLEMAFKSRK